MWKDPVLNWTNKAPVVEDVERWEGNIAHLKGVTDGMLLPLNSKFNNTLSSEYPMGYSAMRVNSEASHGFPETFGNVETVRTTNITATQRLTTTGGDGAIYMRQTSTGVWQPWTKIVTEPTITNNANGTAIRYPDGTQICHHQVTLDLSDGDTAALRKIWTYPATFAANPSGLSVTLAETSGSFAPSKTMISFIGGDTNGSTTSVPLAMYRIAGMTNFAPGNTARVKCTAVGRWK